MESISDSWGDEEDEDDGLPDEAFTEDELAAGVQHIVRTGDPDATTSGRRRSAPVYDEEFRTLDAVDEQAPHIVKTLRFETLDQAREWAKANPGEMFTRTSDGRGFEARLTLQTKNETNFNKIFPKSGGIDFFRRQKPDEHRRRMMQIMGYAKPLYYVINYSGGNCNIVTMRRFDVNAWQACMNNLDAGKLKYVHFLVTEHLNHWRKTLQQLDPDPRSLSRVKSGISSGGEELIKATNKVAEWALIDIENRLKVVACVGQKVSTVGRSHP